MQHQQGFAVDADFVAVDVDLQRVIAIAIGRQAILAECEGEQRQETAVAGEIAIEDEFATGAVQLGDVVRRREQQGEKQAAADVGGLFAVAADDETVAVRFLLEREVETVAVECLGNGQVEGRAGLRFEVAQAAVVAAVKGDGAVLQALVRRLADGAFVLDADVFDVVFLLGVGEAALQIEQGNALFLVAGEIATDEVQLGGAQAQCFAVAAAGAAAAADVEAVAALQPLLASQQPFAVAAVGGADVAVPAQGEAVAVEVGGTVRLDADDLVDLAEDGDAGLQAQVVFGQVGGETAVAFAVGDAGADEVDAAVEQRCVVDARVQGGAVPGRLATEGTDADAQVGLAAEVAALVVLKLENYALEAHKP